MTFLNFLVMLKDILYINTETLLMPTHLSASQHFIMITLLRMRLSVISCICVIGYCVTAYQNDPEIAASLAEGGRLIAEYQEMMSPRSQLSNSAKVRSTHFTVKSHRSSVLFAKRLIAIIPL